MIVKILDIETLKTKWLFNDSEFSGWWWTEGNGSCDCNRHLFFNRGDAEEEEECTSNRYFIIDVQDETFGDEKNDYSYNKDVLNNYNIGYDSESFKKCVTILNRDKKIETILK